MTTRHVPTHREMYPDQYSHPRCGQHVQVVYKGKLTTKRDGTPVTGIIERVVNSRYGLIAILEGSRFGENDGDPAWLLSDCKPLDNS